MKLIHRTIAMAWLMLGCMATASAQEYGTREEAQKMVEAAVAHAKSAGTEQAFKDFSDKSNMRWRNKDLYVFVFTMQGDCVAHGGNEKLIGKNLIEMKDPNGKFALKESIEIASTRGAGWHDYDWPHPQTKKVMGKASYVSKLVNFDGFVGVGVYR